MRRYTIPLLLLLSSSAFAADYRACAWPMCGGFHDAVTNSLADEGLTEVDGLLFSTDATGQGWLTILSTDSRGLDLIAPHSGARTLAVPDTVSFARTVPMALEGIDTVTLPGVASVSSFAIVDGISGTAGGGTSGDGECYESCVCTEDGPECWIECP